MTKRKRKKEKKTDKRNPFHVPVNEELIMLRPDTKENILVRRFNQVDKATASRHLMLF